MSREDPPACKAGYKSPPVEHQFKKGRSGNPAGRPRKPVRALLPRQLRRDILEIGETKTRVRTPDGERDVSAYEAVLIRLLHKALAGHGPSMRCFITLYGEAVLSHAEEFKKPFEFVEMVEHDAVVNPVPRENEKYHRAFIDELRRKTRRL